RRLLRVEVIVQGAADLAGTDVTQGQGQVEIVERGQAELPQHRRQVGLGQGDPAQFLLQQLAAGLQVAGAVDAVEPGAHLVAGAAGDHEPGAGLGPVAARCRLLAGEDLDAVAADRLVVERHDAAVDLGAAAAVADLGVHGVGEVEHGGATRQVDDFAARGDHVDAVLDQLGGEAGGQRLLVVAARLQQLPHPGDLALESGVGAAAFLVAPVRGDAELGVLVHLVGADLHFQRAPARADHRGVQAAVVVALGLGDVVVELAGNRRPELVRHAERRVAGRDVVHQHAGGTDVVELAEGDALALHLLPDAVDVLGRAGALGVDAGLGQGGAQARL